MQRVPITFTVVPGQGRMAVCTGCDRHAAETRISRYCIAAVEGTPLLCDECFEAKKDEVPHGN